jgi:hypothetical protein
MDKYFLEAALEGLTAQRDRLVERIAQLEQLTGKRGPGRPKKNAGTDAAPKSRGKRRKMSAEARARIAEAQRKRWAAFHKESKKKAT